MSTEERFFVESLPDDDSAFELAGREGSHAAGSRRLRPGDSVTLFDGNGYDLICEVVEAQGKRLVLTPVAREAAGPALCVRVTCASALPKGSREDILVSKCAELGIAELVPVDFSRSVVRAAKHWEKRRERFRRLSIEAAKQSGQSALMELGSPLDFEEFLASKPAGLGVFGSPRADEPFLEVLERAWPFERLTFAIGPEGGLTEEEETAASDAGLVPVCVASTVLRIETAAVAFASASAAFLFGRKGP